MSDDREPMTNAQLEAQLAAVYASTSWRITAPLRLVGSAVKKVKRTLVQATISPRAFARRAALGLIRSALLAIKRSPLLSGSARWLHRKFPIIGERVLRRLKSGAFTSMERSSVQVVAIMRNTPYAWDSSTSPSSQFKAMLSHELQRRQNKKTRI